MLIRRAGGKWEQPGVQWYENEYELQHLISESPHLVGADASVVALREFALHEAGSLDVLLVDTEGDLTLVEAKLNRNPEIRRAVVGQLMGYAGALWGMSYEDLDRVVRTREGASLEDLARAASGDGADFDAQEFRQAVARKLREGAFRLVFAVDQITEDLRRAVQYLNAHTIDNLEVVVLELAYSKIDDIEILVPNTFGEEAARRKQADRKGAAWTERDFFQALEEIATAEEVSLVRRLHEWAMPRCSSRFWGEGQLPSCTYAFDVPEGVIQPCSVYLSPNGVGIAINFEWARKRPTAVLEQFLDHLQGLPGIAGMRDDIVARDFRRRPTVASSEYAAGGLDQLVVALEGLLNAPPDDLTSSAVDS